MWNSIATRFAILWEVRGKKPSTCDKPIFYKFNFDAIWSIRRATIATVFVKYNV